MRLNARSISMNRSSVAFCRTAGDSAASHNDRAKVATDGTTLARIGCILAIENRCAISYGQHCTAFDMEYGIFLVRSRREICVLDDCPLFENHPRNFSCRSAVIICSSKMKQVFGS